VRRCHLTRRPGTGSGSSPPGRGAPVPPRGRPGRAGRGVALHLETVQEVHGGGGEDGGSGSKRRSLTLSVRFMRGGCSVEVEGAHPMPVGCQGTPWPAMPPDGCLSLGRRRSPAPSGWREERDGARGPGPRAHRSVLHWRGRGNRAWLGVQEEKFFKRGTAPAHARCLCRGPGAAPLGIVRLEPPEPRWEMMKAKAGPSARRSGLFRRRSPNY